MSAKVEQQQGKIGRSHLVAKLRESGLSRRQSVQVVNAIPEAMIDALRRGEDVEFPFGQLSRIERCINKHWEAIDDLGRPDQNRSTVVYQVDMDAEWSSARRSWPRLARPRNVLHVDLRNR